MIGSKLLSFWHFQDPVQLFDCLHLKYRGEAVLRKHTWEESWELLKRKPNKQYHTENQGLRSRTIFLRLDQLKTNSERPKSAPLSRFKKGKFLNVQKDTIIELLSILQCQKIPERTCIKLENRFPPTGNSNPPFSTENLSKNKKLKNEFSLKIFLVKVFSNHIVSKTIGSPLCLRNVSFVEKLTGLRWKQIRNTEAKQCFANTCELLKKTK